MEWYCRCEHCLLDLRLTGLEGIKSGCMAMVSMLGL